MTMHKYPLSSDRHLVERLPGVPEHGKTVCWVLRDDNHQIYHNVLHLSDDPVAVRLFWKADAKDNAREVGCFRLHLRALLAGKFIRYDPKDVPSDDVRVQFRRHGGGVIHLQTTRDQISVAVGEVP